MAITTSSPLLVVGAGTWGTSTALHLARRGYTNVTVLDAYPFPSSISAGNDVNKIISVGHYNKDEKDIQVNEYLGHQAMQGWTNDPIFKPYYHETGLVLSACTSEGLDQLGVHITPGEKNPTWVELSKPEEFQNLSSTGVLHGQFPGWRGYFRRSGAGWAHARNAMVSGAYEAQRLGVKFVTGSPQGRVATLLYEDGDVKGAMTADGTSWRAEQTFLCAGANADQLLNFHGQLRPTAWTLVHLTLTPEERLLYKNLPVIFNSERGFFFEPNEAGEIKICDEHPGYTNMLQSEDGLISSVPFERTQVPKESEDRVRALLRETMPQLADRPFTFARICWCADTPRREFIIDRHPAHPSLILGCGASGRGFKLLPTIGSIIVDAMENKIPAKIHEVVKWNPEAAKYRDWKDKLGRSGGPNRVMDFQEVEEWSHIKSQSLSTL